MPEDFADCAGRKANEPHREQALWFRNSLHQGKGYTIDYSFVASDTAKSSACVNRWRVGKRRPVSAIRSSYTQPRSR